MSLGSVLILILILMLIGALPTWPHSRKWGGTPFSVVAVILVIVLIAVLTGAF